MAVTAVNLARVTNNLRAFNLREALRSSQLGLYRVQNQLATGYRFLQPSDDPVRSASAAEYTRRLDWTHQIQGNLGKVNAALTETDTAVQDALRLLSEAHTLAVQTVGDTVSPDERRALSVIIDSTIDQLVALGNRKHLNTYLFAGQQARTPFERGSDGVVYHGDAHAMRTLVDTDFSDDEFTVPGTAFFRAVSSEVRGVVDLDPAVTARTRIGDLNGARGRGVTLGRIAVSGGGQTVEVDLRDAATVGDLVDRLNTGLPAWVRASLSTRGIVLTRAGAEPATFTVSDLGGGSTAADLGLAGTSPSGSLAGDIDPRLTPLTRLGDLRGGLGLQVTAPLVIRNGSKSARLTFAGAATVEDVLNQINGAGVDVWARIGDDGRTLDIRSRVSGANLVIEESGGQTATQLGLRSLYGGTELSRLNDGRGVHLAEGPDLRVRMASGAQFDVDLDGARTLQDVLDRLNTAAGGLVTADLVASGNGLRLTDQTIGGEPFTIQALGGALALGDLGLDVVATGNQILGRDVNPVRVDGPFTALLELRAGLQADDRAVITTAAQRLERVLLAMQEVQGQLAARARVMSDRSECVEAENSATQILLSDVRDVDIADAAVRLQQFQTALQANMSTANRVMNLSLLDYLD